MKKILKKIKNCTECTAFLPFSPNPVVSISPKSKIVLISQAPGRIVNESSIPWSDNSGVNLRNWLGVTDDVFYNPENFAIMPMGFCFPGTGKSGDLPPRKECAPKWHDVLIKLMPDASLYLLIGQYAQNYYLGQRTKKNLTETVLNFHEYLPKYFPLPHPSGRNNIWQAKNKWFAAEVLPELKKEVEKRLE